MFRFFILAASLLLSGAALAQSKVTVIGPVTPGDVAIFSSPTVLKDGGSPSGSGTVTSVGLALPGSIFTVTGSPVSVSGTLTGSLISQTANTFFAAPNGSSGTPTFRAIVGADLPVPSATTLGGIESITCAAHTWINVISTAGAPTCAQPVIADLTAIAANTVVGSIAGGAPAALTQTQLTTLINPFTSALSGAVPASGGGTTNYLRADGTFAAPSGGPVLINTLTAANQATLADTTSLTSTYARYEIVFSKIVPATTEQPLELQVYSGGAYKTTGYLSTNAAVVGSTASPSTSTTFISLSSSTNTNSNAANAAPGYSGSMFVDNPSASAIAQWYGQMTWYGEAGGADYAIAPVGGMWNTAGVITGFQVLFGSGNITSGTIKIYGIP